MKLKHLNKTLFLLIAIFILQSCNRHSAKTNEVYISEKLTVCQITDNVYEHISFLNTTNFGKVSCNGMIVVDGNKAIVFDTPTDNEVSKELINWITSTINLKITAVIPTHFHTDNLGGLAEFHKHNIPSYAYFSTIDYAEKNGYTIPQNSFDSKLELPVGTKKVYVEFLGEGHTRDNIIGYFPHDKVLFGGCLIKEIGAGKGNLEDANVKDWAETVKKLKQQYPDAKVVIPGHGKLGGTELLDYTIDLFRQ
jgi:metallo-beta-lactamase class B